MPQKDIDQLITEIDAAVNPQGHLPKTTGPGLNALLRSLATELTNRPEAGALTLATSLADAAAGAVPTVEAVQDALLDEQYQQPFVFQVYDYQDNTGVASLSLAQARQLITGAVPTVDVTSLLGSGDAFTLTVGYDAAQAAFFFAGKVVGTDDPLDLIRTCQVGQGGPLRPLPLGEGVAGEAIDRTTGKPKENTQATRTGYLPVQAGQLYAASFDVYDAAFYDAAYTYLGAWSDSPSRQRRAPAQAAYVRLSTDTASYAYGRLAYRAPGGAATFAQLQGVPADNPALAAALAATQAPASPALEFVFEASYADTIGRTLGPRQAGTYPSEQRQNVGSVSYRLNGQPATLPLTLAATDVLQVAITRLDTAQPAVLLLTT